MVSIPINITGGTYAHDSLSLSNQVTQNLFPQLVDDPFSKEKYVLNNWVGLKSFSTLSGVGRGMYEHRGVLYAVSGIVLYSISTNGDAVELGKVYGTDICIFQGINDGISITTGGRVYFFSDDNVQTLDSSIFEKPNSCAHLNNQMIYDGSGGRFGVSDVGDPTSIDGLNYATAESNADNLLRVYSWDQKLYLFGEKTIETWWNDGAGNPPFSRIEGGIIQKGLAALNSVSSNDNYIYFLGDDFNVYAMANGVVQIVSNYSLSKQISGYSVVSDAVAWCMTVNGVNFYCISFPTANKTWVYLEGGQWFEWCYGAVGGRSRAISHAFAHNKNYIQDHSNGKIYESSFNFYDDDGDAIIRKRDSAVLHGGLLGGKYANKRMTMNKLQLICEAGVGALDGQGVDPEVMMSYSNNGGRTFSTERRGKIGRLGDFRRVVEWNVCGSFRERIIRISMSDPVQLTIHNMIADVEVGI